MKHFLHETDFTKAEIREIFALAKNFKKNRSNHIPQILENQSWGLLFYKNSLRTRLSFEVGIKELGGNTVYLDEKHTQIARGESIEDTAKVMSRYLHGVVIRTFEHSILDEFIQHSTIPVVNALTDFLHPCQIFTDVLTMMEKWTPNEADPFAAMAGRKVVYFGDCNNNMSNSWILASKIFGFDLVLAGPEGYGPESEVTQFLIKENLDDQVLFTQNVEEAATEADMIYTDVWVSMGMEEEAKERIQIMNPYSVTMDVMNMAKDDALFMHCMPTHPGQEVSQEVLDSEYSIIYDEAENRLHMQKAILAALSSARKAEQA